MESTMRAEGSEQSLGVQKSATPPIHCRDRIAARRLSSLLMFLLCLAATGCYVPLRSPATPASCLPDSYRMPMRSMLMEQNLSSLVLPKPDDYLLGPDDILRVTVRGLSEQPETAPIDVQVMADGTVSLPLVGAVSVDGMNVATAQEAIESAYRDGQLVNPRVSLSLATKGTIDVTIIGEVKAPGVYSLPRYQNDIGHGIGLAGGLTEFANDEVKVHRRMRITTPILQQGLIEAEPIEIGVNDVPLEAVASEATQSLEGTPVGVAPADSVPTDEWVDAVIRIPLRGGSPTLFVHGQQVSHDFLATGDLSLRARDVVTVSRRTDPVFFVVGPLSDVSAVNFTVSDRDRQLGNAFILPDDRDIDAVTAVVMAGYIDPIESPSTVTIHRTIPGAPPQLIRVDLIAARYSWNENIYIEPGDIIYLNPDARWWWRRTFDRFVPELFTIPYAEGLARWINPFGGTF